MSNLNQNTTYGTQSAVPSYISPKSKYSYLAELNNSGKSPFQAQEVANQGTPQYYQGIKDALVGIRGAQAPVTTEAPFMPAANPREALPIPSDYSGFKTAGQANENYKWSTPISPEIRSLPGDTMGQYVADTANPGALIKSERGYSPIVNSAMLNGRLSSKYQIDHIVPLALGGADTMGNRELLTMAQNDRKTKAQAIPYTLYSNGKISLGEARVMASQWKDRDLGGIPQPDNYGLVPLDVAQQVQARWAQPKAITFKDVMSELPTAVKNFGKGFLPNSVREFIKGFENQATLGFVPYEQGEDENGFDRASGFVGQVAGAIMPFALAGRVIKGAVGAVSAVGRVFGVLSNTAKATAAAKDVWTVTKEGQVITESAAPEVSYRIWGALKGTYGKVMKKPDLTVRPEYIMKGAVKPLTDQNIQKALQFGTANVMIGQLQDVVQSKFTPDILSGKESTKEIELSFPKILEEFTVGSVAGIASPTLKGAALAMAPVLSLGYIEDPDNPENAFIHSLVFGALHIAGSGAGKRDLAKMKQDFKTASQTKEYRDFEAIENQAHRNILEDFTGEKIPKNATAGQIAAIEKKAVDNLDAMRAFDINPNGTKRTEGMSDRTYLSNRAQILTAANKLSINSLPADLKEKAIIDNVISYFKMIKSPGKTKAGDPLPSRFAQLSEFGTPAISRKVAEMLPEEYSQGTFSTRKPGITSEKYPVGGSVGTGVGIDSNMEGVQRFLRTEEGWDTLPVIQIVDNPHFRTAAQIKNKLIATNPGFSKHTPDPHPENAAMVWGMKKNRATGQIKLVQLGYIPSEARLNTDQYAVNKQPFVGEGAGLVPPFELHKELIVPAMRQNNVKVLLATMDMRTTAETIKSKRPFVAFNLTEKNWDDSIAFASKLETAPNTNSAATSIRLLNNAPEYKLLAGEIANAVNKTEVPGSELLPKPAKSAEYSAYIIDKKLSGQERFRQSVIQKQLLLRQLQRGEIQYDQQTYGLLNEVKDILDTGNPAKMKSNFETQLGIKMNDEQAKYVFENRENMTMRDELEMLTGAINSNNASAVTRARVEFTKTYLESDAFKSSENAKIFPEAKVLGGVKKETPTVLGSNNEQLPQVKVEPEPFQPIAAEEMTQVPAKQGKSTWRYFNQPGRGKEGINSITGTYEIAGKELTRKNLGEIAKRVSDNAENISKGWPKFQEEVTAKIRAEKGDPKFQITDSKELNDLQWLYKRLARSSARNEIVSAEAGGSSVKSANPDNIREIEVQTRQYARENGLSEDSMSTISVGKDLSFDKVKGAKNDSRVKAAHIESEMKNNGYIPIGITAKGAENIIGVKYEPKLVKKFDASPEQYLNDKETLSSDYDKFLRVYITDVLGLPKDISAGDFVKRSNLIYNRYDRYAAADEGGQINVHILTSKKINESMPGSANKDIFENPEHPYVANSISSFESGSMIDGKIIIGENLWNRLMGGLNFDPKKNKTGLKPIISGVAEGENGETMRMIQKGHAIKADPAIREELKNEYGLELDPNDIASFNTNAKIGPKTGTYKIKLSDFYAKALSTGDESRGTVSMQRKFTGGDEGVSGDVRKATLAKKENYNQFIDDINASNNKDELKAVLDKYAEQYGFNQDELFYGDLKKANSLGAAKITLGHNIQKLAKNIFFDNILTDTTPNSGKVFISSPIKLKLDGPDAPARYPKDDEVILGKEALAKIGVVDGEEVMIIRNPSVDINNVVIAKAIDGSKYGHTSLGDEHAFVSPVNERLRLQGDQDGDMMSISKIGEGGVPSSYATAVKSRGSKIIPFNEVNPNPDAAKPVTQESIRNVIKGQLVGDDQTSKIAMVNRVMDMLDSNKITVTLGITQKGRSRYTVFANGKVVETGGIKIPEGDELGVEATYTPKWGFEEKQLRTQALQEAVDSKKSHDIIRRTEGNNPVWMWKQVFSSESGEPIANNEAMAISKALGNFGKIFDVAPHGEKYNTLDDVVTDLRGSIELFKNIRSEGVQLTPLEEKVVNLSDIKTYSVPDEVRISADKAGSKAVREQITVDHGNKALTDIRKAAMRAKNKYFDYKNTKKADRKKLFVEVSDLYRKNLEEGKYTKEDIDAIAYWASVSSEANFGQAPTFNSPKFIYRFNEMINESPEVAKVYYEAMEGSGKKVEAPKTTSNDGTGGPGWFSGITDKFKSLFGPKTEAKTNEFVPADPSTDLNKYKALAAISGAKQAQPTTISEDIPEYTGVFSPDGYVKAYPSLQKAIGKKNLDVKKFLYAIGQNETNVLPSDERYGSSQDSGVEKLGKTLGIYRVSEGDLSTYGKRYLGREITKDEFLNSPELQNQYLTNMAQYWFDLGFTPEEIADIHRSGVSGSLPEGKGKGKYTHPEYITKFNENYYK